MANRQTRTQQRQQRKSEIIDAAITLFNTRGIPETTLVDIAEAAGTTRATLYKYFETKEAILKSILENLLNNLILEVENLPDVTDNPPEFMDSLKEFVYEIFLKYRKQLQLLYGYNFIYTDENPGPPLRINHLIAGKETMKSIVFEKKLVKNGIIKKGKLTSNRLHVFLETLLGLSGQLAGRGGILEDIKGISPKTYLDNLLDMFIDSLQ